MRRLREWEFEGGSTKPSDIRMGALGIAAKEWARPAKIEFLVAVAAGSVQWVGRPIKLAHAHGAGICRASLAQRNSKLRRKRAAKRSSPGQRRLLLSRVLTAVWGRSHPGAGSISVALNQRQTALRQAGVLLATQAGPRRQTGSMTGPS
jgi:hypothetical protein